MHWTGKLMSALLGRVMFYCSLKDVQCFTVASEQDNYCRFGFVLMFGLKQHNPKDLKMITFTLENNNFLAGL